MDKRHIEISLEKAQQWYKQGGELRDIVLQAFTEAELQNMRPHSWFDFCKDYPIQNGEHYITADSDIFPAPCSHVRNYNDDQNLCTSRQEAESFLALMQLRQLRKAWVGDWEPDDKQPKSKYRITILSGAICIESECYSSGPLIFPTFNMASEFLKDFGDLIEVAKPLI